MICAFKFGINTAPEIVHPIIERIFGQGTEIFDVCTESEAEQFVDDPEYPVGKILISTSKALSESPQLQLKIEQALLIPTFNLILFQTGDLAVSPTIHDNHRVHFVTSDQDAVADLMHHFHGIRSLLYSFWVETSTNYILNSYEEIYTAQTEYEEKINDFITAIAQEVSAKSIRLFLLRSDGELFLPAGGVGYPPIQSLAADVAIDAVRFEDACLTYTMSSPELQRILSSLPASATMPKSVVLSTFRLESDLGFILYSFDHGYHPVLMWQICSIGSREIFHLLRSNEIRSQYRTLRSLTMIHDLDSDKRQALGEALGHLQRFFGSSSVAIVEKVPVEDGNYEFEKTYFENTRIKHDSFPSGKGFADYCVNNNKALLITQTVRDGSPGYGVGIALNPDHVSLHDAEAVKIDFVLAPRSVEREHSLVYFPLKQGEEIIGAIKVSDFDSPNVFALRDLRALGVFADPIVTLLTNLASIGRLKSRIQKKDDQNAMAAHEEVLFYYRETSLGIFHQVSNYLQSIGAYLLNAEVLSGKFGARADELNELIKQSRGFAKESMAMIHQAQQRGRSLKPVLKYCQLVESVVRPAIDYAKKRIAAKHLNEAKDIAVEHFLTNKDYRVHIDPDLAKESLINIINNAIWAVNANKLSSKRHIRILVRELPEEKAVRITIEDSGIGISPEDFPKLFTRFFTTREDEGTGLGLYFARHLIEEFGGTIKIPKSYLGKGTTVEITFPVKEK